MVGPQLLKSTGTIDPTASLPELFTITFGMTICAEKAPCDERTDWWVLHCRQWHRQAFLGHRPSCSQDLLPSQNIIIAGLESRGVAGQERKANNLLPKSSSVLALNCSSIRKTSPSSLPIFLAILSTLGIVHPQRAPFPPLLPLLCVDCWQLVIIATLYLFCHSLVVEVLVKALRFFPYLFTPVVQGRRLMYESQSIHLPVHVVIVFERQYWC